jgi:putative copper resistance protein D
LAGFATIGTMMVAAVTATGLVNGFFLVGVANIATLPQSRYGQLLILKLVLFAGMLLLAANNRFRLTPALEVGIRRGPTDGAVARLRRSLWLEIGAAVTILAVIAWIGILAPPASLN